MIAFVVGVAPNLPGFINSINSNIDPGVGKRPYTFGWILGFIGTSLVYIVLNLIWKPTDTFIPRAIYPDEVYDAGEGYGAERIEGSEANSSGGKPWDAERGSNEKEKE